MTDDEFDKTLIAAAFGKAALEGWRLVTVAGAAKVGALDMGRARMRFPTRHTILLRFGLIADQAALSEPIQAGQPPQEMLFDMLMRRIDVLQLHRQGVLALFRALPADPASALLLASASLSSMQWLLEAAGLAAPPPLGPLRAQGLLAVWLWTVRAWQADDSVDLAATMAGLDTALNRAAQVARSLPGGMAAGVEDTTVETAGAYATTE